MREESCITCQCNITTKLSIRNATMTTCSLPIPVWLCMHELCAHIAYQPPTITSPRLLMQQWSHHSDSKLADCHAKSPEGQLGGGPVSENSHRWLQQQRCSLCSSVFLLVDYILLQCHLHAIISFICVHEKGMLNAPTRQSRNADKPPDVPDGCRGWAKWRRSSRRVISNQPTRSSTNTNKMLKPWDKAVGCLFMTTASCG